ncbi:hypothetical protein XA26_10700 [Mycolicibacterium fortuitum]|uniref:Uncharacterized protein n=1 Tax=Mycolicibacterium fortuitum TaxID=1766 RepID=A0A0N7H811_MYCFO|nr:hypothetical protein [Mycolicibacterium fortuitum]ALI24927.1 hypothetical protein XA26_10700 [Mycolicibacterium fortuitum]MDG5770101.1 hypothetical protein [Mycolicibacterium fortuitum]MDG5781208.1 hypothetical protein [Mycolicibacterium fortuitum]NOQ62287.1 hypothetical protein [Mycolicibacterium fortuitum]OBB31279.1 hypothetical protein A5763_12730 [Mycolicibacterium fortuitum]
MTERLSVDDQGLNAAGTVSTEIAATLAAPAAPSGDPGSQPSHAGVSAIDAALAGVRGRQATRVSDHAQYLKIASGVYRHVDDDGAAAVTRTV